ncbi:4-hydroxy-tetrahydrodipicolinate synthase [Puteibacter caeruleilacunae]|nr:4-hydroxy-tetrahydrodipicolinate synthase [Puteibacter caeruleilacunae]
MRTNFAGSGVALITPFLEDGSIDFDALENLVEFQIENGTNYLVVLGTTAEAATLSKQERKQVVDFIKEKNNKRLPIVVGLGGNNTQEVLNCIEETDFDGIDAILSVVPYYNKPTQEGMFRHFMAIEEKCPVDIILYNVPGRTGVNMTPATTLKLAHSSEKFVAIKEACGDLCQITQIMAGKPDAFQVLSGDDALALPMASLGAEGVISVLANALPGQISRLMQHSLTLEIAEAQNLHFRMFPLIDAMFTEGNPGGVKALMSQLGLIKNELRLPLVPVSEDHFNTIEKLVEKL